MKVGETGEAFFVFETDADVPEDLQTSPLSGPVSDNDLEEQPGVSARCDIALHAFIDSVTFVGTRVLGSRSIGDSARARWRRR